MKVLNTLKIKEMLAGGAANLEINKEYVDSLNVFPVPDGDTGTNMSLTIATAVREMNAVQSDDLDDIVGAFARGALKGARGNSGVILSQIIKGFTTVLKDAKEITTKVFAKAFGLATEVAYNAVTKPKEGTILTVIRYIAENAQSLALRNSNFEPFLEAIIKKGEEILAKTPEMLPVLKKAGVVDAGGMGLIIVLQGFYNVLTGVEMENIAPSIVEGADEALDKFSGDVHELENIKYAYCTEYFVINLFKETTEEDIEKLRDKLMLIGDCVIAIGDLSMVKVHVHTNTPNKAIGYGLKLGELDKIKIENMLEQNRALIAKKTADKKPIGILSICTGDGMANIFKELNVDKIIEGGQTMNPSVEDILAEIERINSDCIILLPNNKNIILAAEQAKELTNKRIEILKTVNVPQGISAVVAFDPELDIDTNVENMTDAYEEIEYGEVTYAVRTTQLDGFDLKEGDVIGLTSKKIVAKSNNVVECASEVIEKLIDEDKSVITLYYGNGVSEEEASEFADTLSEKYEDIEVQVLYGGQPHYYYMMSVE